MCLSFHLGSFYQKPHAGVCGTVTAVLGPTSPWILRAGGVRSARDLSDSRLRGVVLPAAPLKSAELWWYLLPRVIFCDVWPSTERCAEKGLTRGAAEREGRKGGGRLARPAARLWTGDRQELGVVRRRAPFQAAQTQPSSALKSLNSSEVAEGVVPWSRRRSLRPQRSLALWYSTYRESVPCTSYRFLNYYLYWSITEAYKTSLVV